jgi:HAD superfamily hydrolase (TIGR01509 family)
MRIKGVVFDFNGTLFWDTELQNRSWDHFLEKYGLQLSAQEKNTWVHGINAKDTFEFLFKKTCSPEEVEKFTEEKEKIYREMCLVQGMEWAPGAPELISFLKQNKIPVAIATASAFNNVEFFIEHFGLLQFFTRENIVYNDGSLRGKPHPDLFNRAIEKLGVSPHLTAIFEDSLAGVEAAQRAGAGKIFIVKGKDQRFAKYAYPVINHFDKVDRRLFVHS